MLNMQAPAGMRFHRIAAVCVVALACRHAQVPLPAFSPAIVSAATAARGEYIVRNVAVCGGCHAADPKHDVDGPLSGGTEFRDWRIGIARASNLTPDAETGIGSWSDAEIVRAIRNGQRKDGRLLAPVMPYEWFHEMSDDDALSVARYLKSLAPVRHEVTQSPSIAFKLGKLLFLRPKPAVSVATPSRGATAYGGYLAQHAGLCADCHTPRSGLQSKPDKNRLFAGMAHPPKDFPKRPTDLTPDPDTGIGRWSEADFLQTLRSGKRLSGEELDPFMPWRQIRRMSDDDLRAIYVYLRSLPPIRNDEAPAARAK